MTPQPEPSLAQIVAALSVTYRNEGVVIWLEAKRREVSTDPSVLAEHVRRIGDADPADFIVSERPRRPVLRDVPRLPATCELEPECGGGACYCGGCVL